MATKQEIKNFVSNVEGWLMENEIYLLYGLAKNCSGRGAIVEIGSWKGKSTILLAKGSKAGKGGKIYAIDPHEGASEHKKMFGKVWTFDEFMQNIKTAGIADIVVPIVKTSNKAAKDFSQPIELIFIDGEHKFESVKSDFENWFPKVLNGGIIAFHDATRTGPKEVVDELVYKSKKFRKIKRADSIVFAEKVEKNTATERLSNQFGLIEKKIYETRVEIVHSIKKIFEFKK